MATETAFRPRVDQENASALDIKGGNVSGIKLSLLTLVCTKSYMSPFYERLKSDLSIHT